MLVASGAASARAIGRLQKMMMADEHVIRIAEFHPIYTLQAFAVLILCIGIGGGVQYAALRYLHQATMIPLTFGLAIGSWLFLAMIMKRLTTEIALTSERLIYRRGFFFIESQEVDIEQLASDSIS